jgi:membrane protein required for colicin V production
MAFADIFILIVLAATVISGLRQGFLRAVCSLGGLFFGFLLASWNYQKPAALLQPIVRFEPLASTLGFLLIVCVVTLLANLLGRILSGSARAVGLGCIDRLLGAGFGFLQGAFLVSLLILLALTFFPNARWLTQARLPRHFFGFSHMSIWISPEELANRIRSSLDSIQHDSKFFLPPKEGIF